MSAPIVLGFDGSLEAGAALEETIRIARTDGSPVVVVFAYYISPLGGGDVRDYRDALERVAGEETTKALTALESAGVSATARHVSGRPADAILEVADEVDARMIVVGSTGQGRVAAALLGSVVIHLVQRSRVPVLVVPS